MSINSFIPPAARMRMTLACVLALSFVFALGAQGKEPGLKSVNGLTEETADPVIRGKIAGGAPLYFDLAAISALPSRTFTSSDPWDGKTHRFEGVLLSDLMAAVGLDSEATRITVLRGTTTASQ